jgi:hypothetical protein
MTRRILRAPPAKDQLQGLSTKNKEHGKNYENYRNAMRRPFSWPLTSSRSGGAALRLAICRNHSPLKLAFLSLISVTACLTNYPVK